MIKAFDQRFLVVTDAEATRRFYALGLAAAGKERRAARLPAPSSFWGGGKAGEGADPAPLAAASRPRPVRRSACGQHASESRNCWHYRHPMR